MFDSNSFDEFFDELVTSGAVEFSAIDEDGNPLYSFTEKIFEVMPHLAQKVENAFHNDMMSLWQLGFLEMDITLANPVVKITSLATDEEQVMALPQDLRVTLSTIKQAMRVEP